MQIEFIGCTGAGKSTLIARLVQKCREQQIDACGDYDFVLRRVRLDWLQNEIGRGLFVNLISAIVGLLAWRRYSDFYRFAAQVIAQLPVSVPRQEKLRIARNVLKNIGIHELVRRRIRRDQFVFVDEGPLHTAHYLFVHVACEANGSQLPEFMNLVPLPDVAVHVKQCATVLIERTIKRGHKRIADRSRANVASFIERALAVFDRLTSHPLLENRLLITDGEGKVLVSPEYPRTPHFDAIRELVLAASTGAGDENQLRAQGTTTVGSSRQAELADSAECPGKSLL